MRIGIIGSGMIGGTVGRLWAKAGHEVLFSSRHPEALEELARAAGGRAGTVEEAARFGEVVFLAVPYKALPELQRQIGEHLRDKTVIDAGNLYPDRDGAVAQSVLDEGVGAGVATQRHLPGARVVRGFNTVYFKVLEKEAHRHGDGVGIPLAGDDKAALDTAAKLVRDAGFDPVIVGGLGEARRFDAGTPVYNTGMSGPQVRAALGV
jgi:hypothetical protein